MSAHKQPSEHRNYKVRGKMTKRRAKKFGAKSVKGKSGTRFTAPWVCPNPELHGDTQRTEAEILYDTDPTGWPKGAPKI